MAYAIVRINAHERMSAGSAPTLPDDVREVTTEMVHEALEWTRSRVTPERRTEALRWLET
ncbi:MAG: hypothetical protein M3Y87_02245 [Myxococcota bacterium]|nr:hypothetical protein [Myxococcota bacterium]